MVKELLLTPWGALLGVVLTLCAVLLIAWLATNKRSAKYFGNGEIVFTTLYSAMVVTSAIAATKIIVFPLWKDFYVPAGVIVYAASFLITDLIGEVYGKQSAIRTVLIGFLSMLIFSLYSLLIVEWSSAPYWQDQEAFETVVGLSFRITMAGWISFLCSQYWDVFVFDFFKEKIKNNWIKSRLWVRNNVSTITSQLIDSTIFITVAFIGIYENILEMVIAQYIIKVIIALLDTPFAYWGRRILKNESHEN